MNVNGIVQSTTGALVAGLMTLAPAISGAAEPKGPYGFTLTWRQDPTTTMVVQWLEEGRALPVVGGGETEATTAMAVPHIPDAAVDGTVAWWDRGLAAEFFADPEHRVPAEEDLRAAARLGWNEQGLLVAVRVRDDAAFEHANVAELWRADSVEFFLSDGVGSTNRIQVVLAPGVRGEETGLRHNFGRLSGGPAPEELSIQAVSAAAENGYVVEALLPWSNLPGYEPARGAGAALQILVNDVDAADGPRRVSLWYPVGQTHANPHGKYALTLAEQASAPVRARTEMRQQDGKWVVDIFAAPQLVDQSVRVVAGEREIGTARLARDGNMARARVELADAPQGQRWGAMTALAGDTWLGDVRPPSGYGRETPPAAKITYWAATESEQQARSTEMEVRPIEQWGGQFIQRTELTGLQPYTRYRFRAGENGRELAFSTMPRQLNRPLRIAFGGDERHRQDWMERVNRVAMEQKPAFIVWGGDHAYADGLESNISRWVEWFEANDNTLISEDGQITPIVVGIGNHEVRGGYYRGHSGYEQTDEWRQRIAPYFYQFFAFPAQPGYGVLDFGDYLSLIILDTDHSNPIEGVQTQWLERTLSERQNRPHVFPIYHVPGYPSHRPYDGGVSVRVREHWVPLFERNGIQLAFEHHDHTYKRTVPIRAGKEDPTGITYLGDGAWGVGTRPVHDPKETWYLERAESVRHAIIMTIDGSQRRIVVYSEEGAVVDELRKDAAQRTAASD